jgi:hypothetical protein
VRSATSGRASCSCRNTRPTSIPLSKSSPSSKPCCERREHRYAKAGWWNPLAKFAFPIIGGLSLDEIEISHITAIMLRAEKAGAPDTARRVRSRIELVLNAAIAQGLRTATLINPPAAS